MDNLATAKPREGGFGEQKLRAEPLNMQTSLQMRENGAAATFLRQMVRYSQRSAVERRS